MIELLFGMNLQLGSDFHVFGTAEHLGINHVGNDGLVFAREVFVQQIRETVAGNFDFGCGESGVRHFLSPCKFELVSCPH